MAARAKCSRAAKKGGTSTKKQKQNQRQTASKTGQSKKSTKNADKRAPSASSGEPASAAPSAGDLPVHSNNVNPSANRPEAENDSQQRKKSEAFDLLARAIQPDLEIRLCQMVVNMRKRMQTFATRSNRQSGTEYGPADIERHILRCFEGAKKAVRDNKASPRPGNYTPDTPTKASKKRKADADDASEGKTSRPSKAQKLSPSKKTAAKGGPAQKPKATAAQASAKAKRPSQKQANVKAEETAASAQPSAPRTEPNVEDPSQTSESLKNQTGYDDGPAKPEHGQPTDQRQDKGSPTSSSTAVQPPHKEKTSKPSPQPRASSEQDQKPQTSESKQAGQGSSQLDQQDTSQRPSVPSPDPTSS